MVDLRGLLPDDFYLMQRADHGIEPAGLDPRCARNSGNAPRGHVSEAQPFLNLLPTAVRRISQGAVGNHLGWLLVDPLLKFFHALMVHQKSFHATGKRLAKKL